MINSAAALRHLCDICLAQHTTTGKSAGPLAYTGTGKHSAAEILHAALTEPGWPPVTHGPAVCVRKGNTP